MLKVEQLQIPNLMVTKYTFSTKGTILPEHTHDKDTEHITIILSGSLECDYGTHVKHLHQGEVYDHTENEQTHELRALEENTTILNITKNSSMDFYTLYQQTPEEEEKQRLAKEKWEKEQEEFRQNQLDHIKRIEEEDRAKGIVV